MLVGLALMFLASGTLSFAKDLSASLRDIGQGRRDITALDRAYAIVDLVLLAALADGDVTASEREALGLVAFGQGELRVTALERLALLEAYGGASQWRTRTSVEARAKDLAAKLQPRDRLQVFRLVCVLAAEGAAVGRDPDPSRANARTLDRPLDYRTAATPDPSTPPCSIEELFAAVLGISGAQVQHIALEVPQMRAELRRMASTDT